MHNSHYPTRLIVTRFFLSRMTAMVTPSTSYELSVREDRQSDDRARRR
jgi:hypothetical protein